MFGAVNMIVGNLLALRQTQVKRLLAFSSLTHVGYMLLGLGFAVSFGQADGAQGGVFHLLTHAAMKGLAFLAAGCLLFALRLSRGDRGPLIRRTSPGPPRRYPSPPLALTVALLGLGGLPPLGGFMSKWQIFASGVHVGQPHRHRARGLRRPEQPAVPGLLRAAGEHRCTAASRRTIVMAGSTSTRRAWWCPLVLLAIVVVALRRVAGPAPTA